MTTQVRPLAGGTWNNLSQTPLKVTKKDTTFGVTLPSSYLSIALRALNEWVNCAGAAPGATLAQETAKAIGLQIQEI